ncbi:MAG: HAD-IA family hydrolase [Xylophilus ampelinus]
MHDASLIRAITLDLDDTLWPIWPTIEKAELALQHWLRPRAPAAAGLLADAEARMALRRQVTEDWPDRIHDLGALRREMIRRALERSGEDASLAEGGYEVFIAARHEVVLYEDARQALDFLSARWPLVALTNGNADVHRIGLGGYFRASVSAGTSGFAKPDARIFRAAAEALGLEPGQVLHVGDDSALDVVGALAAGMQAVWINRSGAPWPHEGPAPVEVEGLAQLCRLLDIPGAEPRGGSAGGQSSAAA